MNGILLLKLTDLNQALLTVALRELHGELLSAESYEDAAAILAEGGVDLIISEDTPNLRQELADMGCATELPILILVENIEEADPSVIYLKKPYTIYELLTMLDSIFQPRSIEELDLNGIPVKYSFAKVLQGDAACKETQERAESEESDENEESEE